MAAPHRASPTSAPRRAVSVASVSADGIARSSSEYWITRPAPDRFRSSTMSIAADGGCDSRSSSSSVRSTRGSRIAAGSCSTRAVHGAIDEAEIEPQRRGAAIGPFERDTDSGSSSRASTNDNGSSVSIGHSSSIVRQTAGCPGRARAAPDRFPARQLLEQEPVLPHPRRQLSGRQRRKLAERRQSPAARHVERRSNRLRAASWPLRVEAARRSVAPAFPRPAAAGGRAAAAPAPAPDRPTTTEARDEASVSEKRGA